MVKPEFDNTTKQLKESESYDESDVEDENNNDVFTDLPFPASLGPNGHSQCIAVCRRLFIDENSDEELEL